MRRCVCASCGVRVGAALAGVIAGGCARRADMDQVQNEQAQFRSIVAANRQQLQAMDVRMRQLEDQIQQLRNGPAGAPVDPAKAGASEDRLARLEAAVTALQASSTSPTYTSPPSSTVPTEPPDRTASLGGGPSGGSSYNPPPPSGPSTSPSSS